MCAECHKNQVHSACQPLFYGGSTEVAIAVLKVGASQVESTGWNFSSRGAQPVPQGGGETVGELYAAVSSRFLITVNASFLLLQSSQGPEP
ncbi:hypothetical protein Q5P01_026453 [Channa striata]|uniref:Uncharacterized protein n=1 Tax=Channa striata TaxID=64152 RepID=A0AA88LG71_CHASR|nr:hypothetical protein Q5P01_026453 [Channa striata]